MANKKYFELKDQDTSFHDPETGLTVRRDEAVEISEPYGAKTAQAIAAGRLVPADAAKAPEGSLADEATKKGPIKPAAKK